MSMACGGQLVKRYMSSLTGHRRDNNHKFCPYCGKEIREVKYKGEDV